MADQDRHPVGASTELVLDAATRMTRYLEGLGERRVAPDAQSLQLLERFSEPLPQRGFPAEDTLQLLDSAGSCNTMATTGGRYYGFVNGGTLPDALAANMLSTAWDQNTALSSMSPVASKLQQVASAWIVEALALPPASGAFFVGGATVANLCGIVAARDAVLARAGHDVVADGLIGAPPVRVLAGASVHSTTAKALAIAGLGRDTVTIVPVDDQGRMRVASLDELAPDASQPTLVLAQAGEVNSGAFDPFEQIAAWAHERGAWVHVDGAFGLWAAASAAKRHLVRGLAEADSWATDGHKWLNLPYDSGIVIVRDPATLRRSMAVSAAYLVDDGGVLEPMHHTPQSSQRGRAIDAWAALRGLGREGLSELVERCCSHAARFAQGLRAAGYQILNDVELNQVLVSFGSDRKTEAVVRAVQEGGVCWCGPTEWRGQRAMRISVSSWATTEADVERSLAAMLEAANNAT